MDQRFRNQTMLENRQIIGEPTALWKGLFVDAPREVWVKEVSKFLDGSALRLLSSCNRAARKAVKALPVLFLDKTTKPPPYSQRRVLRLEPLPKEFFLQSEERYEFAFDNFPAKRVLLKNIVQKSGFCTWIVRHTNSLEFLRWGRSKKGFNDWNVETIKAAAPHGNLAVLKFCVENNCPKDSSIYATFAKHDRLECIAYLHEVAHVPWGRLTAQESSVRCFLYAKQHHCPGTEDAVPDTDNDDEDDDSEVFGSEEEGEDDEDNEEEDGDEEEEYP
jgi:hypothetical protein